MGGEHDGPAAGAASSVPGGGRRPYWRSQSWSASRGTVAAERDGLAADAADTDAPQGLCFPAPLTPRSQQNCKARSCLPPLQPLAIARRSVDEWPKAGSDDVGDWPQPPTPGARPAKRGEDLKLDLSLLRSEGWRSQIAFFDKECSKVAEHIYLGGDAVARSREILRQNGITHVLNCVGFVCPEYFKTDLVYKTLWLQDSPSEDITSILYDVFDYFEDVREQGGRVFVHCCQGVSRSTSLVIAYLMWRNGQSFEDAFEFVKAARGIANPNMGFACQLLQCQKRVHAVPLSPNSILRLYRMAPHSPYDALHLVPKMLNEPTPLALDSRGAFILHVLSSIYVWVGKKCELVMEKDAKAAAFQVVRYENVPGPIVIVEEGDESSEFWEAFSRAPFTSDPTMKINNQHIELSINIGVGKRRVGAYDADFELFYKGLSGGVLPPFSSAGAGHETHLPARESNWSVLRRKFIYGGMKKWVSASKAAISRAYSDSLLARDRNTCIDRVQVLSADSSSSPPYLSPSSLSSNSSNSSKTSSDSPSISPSTYTPLLTPSPASNSLSDSIPSSMASHKPPNISEPSNICLKVVSSPSKRSAQSLAERRGSFFPSLKLAALTDERSQSSRRVSNASSSLHDCPQAGVSEEGNNFSYDHGTLHHSDNVEQEAAVHSASSNSEQHGDLCKSSLLSENLRCSTGITISSEELLNKADPLVYRWPDSKKFTTLRRDDLNSNSVLLLLAPDWESRSTNSQKLHLWIGGSFKHATRWAEANGKRNVEVKDSDLNQVSSDFIKLIGLPKNIPVKVFREEESDEFLEMASSFLAGQQKIVHDLVFIP